MQPIEEINQNLEVSQNNSSSNHLSKQNRLAEKLSGKKFNLNSMNSNN